MSDFAETPGNGPQQAPVEGDSGPPDGGGSRGTLKTAFTAVGVAVALVAAFFGGYMVRDDAKGERDELLARVEDAKGERDELLARVEDLERCAAVVSGYQDLLAQAEELRPANQEYFLVLEEWAMAEVGSPEEAELESRLTSLEVGLAEQEVALERERGRLEAQGDVCVE
jgi:hypothetical protein